MFFQLHVDLHGTGLGECVGGGVGRVETKLHALQLLHEVIDCYLAIQREQPQFLDSGVPGRLQCHEFQRILIFRQLHRDGEREIPSDLIDARHQDAGPSTAVDNAMGQYKSPNRAGQINVQPVFTNLFFCPGHKMLQPTIPLLDEAGRQIALDKITMRRQFSIHPGTAH